MSNRISSPSRSSVLLVEDNAGDIRLLQEAFKESGVSCALHITRNGEQAMDFLNRKGRYAESQRPSLILLDLNMPCKDGREVLAEIKSERALRCIPVVVLSTSTNPDDINGAYRLHANCYIVKPEDLEGLVRLSKLLECFWLREVWLPTC